MARVEAIDRRAALGVEEGLPLPLADVVITSTATFAAAYLWLVASWAPGALFSGIGFAIIAAGAPVFRALAQRYPGRKVFHHVAAFWLLPAAAFGHSLLNPVIDAANPRLLDRYLALADHWLFGANPSLYFEGRVPGWATDVLMVCYYTYFLWPVALGAVLYRKNSRRVYEQFGLALALFYAANFVLYVAVPAVGPRFFMADHFHGPLHGAALTPLLDSMMRNPSFARDCFPSGHTGITVLVMAYAYVYQRRFFFFMLPWGLGLIAATLVCRFHYGVDLLAALPLVLVCAASAMGLARVRPQGVVVKSPVVPARAPA